LSEDLVSQENLVREEFRIQEPEHKEGLDSGSWSMQGFPA